MLVKGTVIDFEARRRRGRRKKVRDSEDPRHCFFEDSGVSITIDDDGRHLEVRSDDGVDHASAADIQTRLFGGLDTEFLLARGPNEALREIRRLLVVWDAFHEFAKPGEIDYIYARLPYFPERMEKIRDWLGEGLPDGEDDDPEVG